MVVLEWRLTLLALVLLPAVHPPGQAGRAAAPGAHPRGHGPQRVDEHHDDRAVQRLRRPAREAVRPPRRRGRPTSPRGPAGCATSACAAPCTAGRSSPRSRWSARSAPPSSTGRRPAGDLRDDPARHARRAGRLRHADLLAAHQPHQRPRRRDDGLRVVRAGLRGARRAQWHRRRPRRRRAAPAPRPGRARRRVVPLPGAPEVSMASLEGTAARHPRATAVAVGDGAPRRRRAVVEPGQPGGPRRPVGRRQDDAQRARPPPLRRHRRRRAHRRARRARRHPGQPAGRHRRGHPGPAPVPRHGRRQPALRPPRRHRRRARGGVPGGADPRRHRRPARGLRHRRRRARATGCRAARSSASPSPGCCSRTRPIVDPRRGHEPPRRRERGARPARRWPTPSRPHVDRDRPPAVDDPRRRPDPRPRRRPDRRAGHARRAARRAAASTPTSTGPSSGRRPRPRDPTPKRSPAPPDASRPGRPVPAPLGVVEPPASAARSSAMSSATPSSPVSHDHRRAGGAGHVDDGLDVDLPDAEVLVAVATRARLVAAVVGVDQVDAAGDGERCARRRSTTSSPAAWAWQRVEAEPEAEVADAAPTGGRSSSKWRAMAKSPPAVFSR